MKRKARILALGALFPIVLFSCGKNSNPFAITTSVGPYTSMADIFPGQAPAPLTVSMDAGRDTSFYGNSGTRYTFYGNSFLTPSGSIATGAILVQACEYLQKGDMIFSKVLPISNDVPLLSGGEINVSAIQNGQAVYVNPTIGFKASIPQNGMPPDSMQYFSGSATGDTTVFKTNWIRPISTMNIAEVTTGSDTVTLISDSLRKCSAGYFMASPNFQTFTVIISVTGAFGLPDSTVSAVSALPGARYVVYGYALYDGYRGVWPLGIAGSYSNGIFSERRVPNVPVHFVVFTIINGNFYGGILAATPVNGANYTITLSQVDPAAFKAQLNAL